MSGPDADPSAPQTNGQTERDTRKHLRGSSALLAGRVLALVFGFGTQVLIVRALSKSDYGAFAYGLAMVPLIRTVVSLGQVDTFSRFLSIYEERKQRAKLVGSLVLVTGTIIVLGALAVLAVVLARGWLVGRIIDDPTAIRVLVIIVVMGPFEAIDMILEGTLAVISKPRAIVLRKYVLAPLLKLAAVLVVLAAGGGAFGLAIGYVIGGALGTLAYASISVGALRERGLLAGMRLKQLDYPARELFGFSVPLLTNQLVFLSMSTFSVILLGIFATTEDVAAFRAILPAARMNQLAVQSFSVMFLPLAARLFSRGDHRGMRRSYWETAVWLLVLTFPVFAITGPLAGPTTVLLFGQRYASSAPLLALISLGYYTNAGLGFNAHTLQAYGRVRWLVGVNIVSAVLNVGLNLLLIPRMGALGVAVATAISLVALNIGNQIGLARLGLGFIERRYLPSYASVIVASGALWLMQTTLEPPTFVALGAGAVASVAVLLFNRRLVKITDAFPELGRIRLVKRLLG